MKGRKRHIVVDTLGLLLNVRVTTASVQDPAGAMPLREVRRHRFSRLRLLWADQAYRGNLGAWLWDLRPRRKVRLQIITRPEGTKGVLLLPKRWAVERPFAWLACYRRLSQDDADFTQTSEAMIREALLHLMLRRLARMPTS